MNHLKVANFPLEWVWVTAWRIRYYYMYAMVTNCCINSDTTGPGATSSTSLSTLIKGHSVQKQKRLQDVHPPEGYEMVNLALGMYTTHNIEYSNTTQLRMCGMNKNRSNTGYARSTEYVEVRVKKSASYVEVASTAKGVLGLPDENIGILSIFRSDGTVIPDKSIAECKWTIGGYLRSIRKSCSQIKLGVGYLLQVAIMLNLICIISQP